MKATLTVTSRGVVTLPAKLRNALGIKADDHIIAEATPEGILLRPAVMLPIEMYSPERIREIDKAEAELASVLVKAARPRAGRGVPRAATPKAAYRVPNKKSKSR